MQFGCERMALINAKASSSELGGLKILGCVITRITALSTTSEIPKVSLEFINASNQLR